MNSKFSHISISQAEARDIIVNAQGLINPNLTPLDIIHQIGYVQIDTLAVAARAHHHVFHTRSNTYTPSDLEVMMQNKQVFEYWSHAASYLPMEDYRFSLVSKKEYATGKSHWFEQDKNTISYVLDRIKADGPLQSKDFKDDRTEKQEWYAWKPAKIALEQLFMEGKIMVRERKNFHKVYDLTERVLPDNVNISAPTTLQFCEHLIKKTLRAQGLATLNEIGYLRKGLKPVLIKALNPLLKGNEIIEVKIEKNEQTYFALNQPETSTKSTGVHIVSPFDNILIQRKRALSLFNFDYQIECYVPEKKRVYGYYCLPILSGNSFVGRFDPKADRKTGIFIIKAFWWEEGFIPDNEFISEFANKLRAFVNFCGCQKLQIPQAKKDKYLKELQKLVNSI